MGKASGLEATGMACKPSSALINIGFGKVAARLVLPNPASPVNVQMIGRSSGFAIELNMLIFTTPSLRVKKLFLYSVAYLTDLI
jgi:hypothetical protein